MAGKKKSSSDDVGNDFNFDDLEGFNDEISFDAEDGIDSDNREPSRSKVVSELAKDTGKGFMDGLIRSATKKSLPEEYTHNYYEAMDLVNFTGEVVDKNKAKLGKSVFKLGKEVKKALPFKVSFLDKYLERTEANYEEAKAQSEEQVRDSAIQGELTGIFDKQLEIQKAIEAKRDAEGEVDKKERLIQNKLSMDVLTSIDANLANQTAFTLQVSKMYFKKSLELQFKSYFVQADMLRTMRDSYKAFSLQFTNIEKNTSLPEFVKLKNTERLQDLVRDNMAQSVYKKIFSNSTYLANIKKKLAGTVDEKINGLTDKLDSATDMLSGINDAKEMGGGSAARILSSVASGMLGTTLGEKFNDKFVTPKLKDKLKDNKYVNTGANYLGMLSNSPSTLFKVLRGKAAKAEESYSDEGSPGRWAMSKMFGGLRGLLDTTTPERESFGIKEAGYLDHNQPAIFDTKVHRSITEVIPLYLAKILKQNTDLTSMYQQVHRVKIKSPGSEEQVYDFKNRNLTTMGQLRDNVEKSVFEKKSTVARSKMLSSGILMTAQRDLKKSNASLKDKTLGDNTLGSAKSQKLLEQYIEKAKNVKGVDFSYDGLILGYKDNASLSELVDKSPGLGSLLELLQKNATKATTQMNAVMSDMKRDYPIEAVKQLFNRASLLRKAKSPHIISDDTATIFSKAFSVYILRKNDDIVADNIINLSAFLFLPQNSLDDKVKRSIGVFSSDVRYLKSLGDPVLDSSLEALFGMLNASLKDNIDVDPAAYQILNDLTPGLLKSKELGIENLAEGKLLGAPEDQQYVAVSELSALRRKTKAEVKELREQSVVEGIIDRAVSRGNAALKSAADTLKATRGNPAAVAELAISAARRAKTTVESSVNKGYIEMGNSITKINAYVSNFSDEVISNVVPLLIVETDKLTASIDKNIELQKEDLRQRIDALDRARKDINDAIQQPEFSKASLRELETYRRLSESSLNSLVGFRGILTEQKRMLVDLQASGLNDHKEKVKNLYRLIKETVAKTKKVLEDLENKGKAVEAEALAG